MRAFIVTVMVIAFLAFAIRGFVDHRKARLLDRMEALRAIAMLVFFTALGSEKDGRGSAPVGADEQTRRDAMVAAKVNYLFGEDPVAEHAAVHDLAKLHDEAAAWVKLHPVMRELQIQSLRVKALIHGGGVPSQRVSALLAEHGGAFPVSPDPWNYASLVKRSLGVLNDDDKGQLMAALAKRGLAGLIR